MKRNFEPSLSLEVKGLKVNTPIQLKIIFYDQIHHHLIYRRILRIFALSNLSRMHYLRGLVVVFGFAVALSRVRICFDELEFDWR